MDIFVIRGGSPLEGTVRTSGAKNSVIFFPRGDLPKARTISSPASRLTNSPAARLYLQAQT